MKQTLFFITSLGVLMLSGCTDYQNSFDCPPKPGMGCQSISEIHEAIIEDPKDKDSLPIPLARTCDSTGCGDAYSTAIEGYSTSLGSEARDNTKGALCQCDGSAPRSGYLVSSDHELVYRVPERVVRIWVNGRVTEGGEYVAAHDVFIALKDDGWIRHPQHDREAVDAN